MTDTETYFNTFCRVSHAMQKTFEMESVLTLIVQSARDALKAKACSLFLKNDGKQVFKPAAQVGLSGDYVHTKPSEALDTIKDIMVQGGYIAITDATSDPRVTNHEAKKKEGIGSILVVPVIADEHPIGTLALYTGEKKEFCRQEIDFLSALANQGGTAIQKSRFIERKKKNAALLLSIAEDLSSSLDIDHILHIMSAEIAEAFNFKAVSIRLLDERQEELKMVASYGLSETYIKKGPVYAGALEKMLSNPIEIIDPGRMDEIDHYHEKIKEGIVSILNLPVTIKENVIGVMRIYCGISRKFPEDIVSLLGSVARLGGLAIQNASMYLELQQDKENLEKEIWSHKAWF